jgi:hypothetical protein
MSQKGHFTHQSNEQQLVSAQRARGFTTFKALRAYNGYFFFENMVPFLTLQRYILTKRNLCHTEKCPCLAAL